MREFFLENSQSLISSSKFIMTSRPLNNKRGKKNLICGENYIYSALNKQGVYQHWRCLEYRRENCSAVAKTFIEEKEILNLPEHSHPSNFVSRYAQILDKQNYLQEIGGIMKL